MNSNSLFHSEEAVIKDRFFNLDWIDTAKKTERTISGFSELKPQKKEEPSGSSKQLILPSALCGKCILPFCILQELWQILSNFQLFQIE